MAGATPQCVQQVRRPVLQLVRQEPARVPQLLTQLSCAVSQLFRQVSKVLIGPQRRVTPQQVTDPAELEQMPAAEVQLNVAPPEQASVQVCGFAETIDGPPQVAIRSTASNPVKTRTLGIRLSLHGRVGSRFSGYISKGAGEGPRRDGSSRGVTMKPNPEPSRNLLASVIPRRRPSLLRGSRQ